MNCYYPLFNLTLKEKEDFSITINLFLFIYMFYCIYLLYNSYFYSEKLKSLLNNNYHRRLNQ